MGKISNHPELGQKPNPLFEGLAPFLPLMKLPQALTQEPLAEHDWMALSLGHREALLHLVDQHYWPVEHHLELAMDIQSLVRAGLIARNPLSRHEQVRINRLCRADDPPAIALQSMRVRAAGGLLAGMTGLGKSTSMERALATFAPEQVMRHERSEVCGWSTMTQVAYLIVDAPVNATRAGMLSAVAGALDALLGTDYATDVKRQRNIDSAVIRVVKLLSVHRVGLLVIDENQESTLETNPWRAYFVLFFLGLMNLGVPVLLLGHPAAFGNMRRSAQLKRRFSIGGIHDFQPAKQASDIWWADRFVPGEMRFSLCETIPTKAEVIEATFQHVGGVPGLFSGLWKESNRIAIRRQGKTAVMTRADLEHAAKTPRFRELVSVAKAIAEGNPRGEYTDIPVRPSNGARHVGTPPDVGNNAPTPEESVEAAKRVAANLKGKNTRAGNKEKKDSELRGRLSEDDLRKSVDALSIIAGVTVEQVLLEF